MTASVIITDPQELLYAQQDAVVAGSIGTALTNAYPGRNWHVESDVEQGIAKIFLPEISEEWSMVVHTNTPTWLELEKKVLRYAGEYLERFRLSRERAMEGDMENMKRNHLTGEVIGVKKGELEA